MCPQRPQLFLPSVRLWEAMWSWRWGCGAGSAPHLPEDEVQQQRVVEAVLGVENLPGGTPAQLSWGKSPSSMQRFDTNLIPVQRGQVLSHWSVEQMVLLTPCPPDFSPRRTEQAPALPPIPSLSPAPHLLADVYFPGHIAVGVEVLTAAAVKLGLHLLCLRWELPRHEDCKGMESPA